MRARARTCRSPIGRGRLGTVPGVPESLSTIDLPELEAPDEKHRGRLRRNRLVRRLALGLLTIFILLGAVGVLGVRSRTVTASGGGYTLEVDYAQVARPALAAPWRVTVRHPGGFDGPITLETSADYFELFDANAMVPAPSAETADAEYHVAEFDPPDGNTLKVSFDARIGPNVQWGKTATTRLVIDDEIVAQVTYRTWVLP